MKVPALILKQLYTFGSLENVRGGARFAIKNRLSDAVLTRVKSVSIDGVEQPLDKVWLEVGSDEKHLASDVGPQNPVAFPLRQMVRMRVPRLRLEDGPHEIALAFEADPFGELAFAVKDAIASDAAQRVTIPYSKDNDLTRGVIRKRQKFVEKYAKVALKHIAKYSIDPKTTAGNIENFTGVAQVPLGFAGPIHVKGEHADGDFLVPLATTEGTLVASYNRGIKVLNYSGGVTCTVSDDSMQRAPVFIFEDARKARDFRTWVQDHMESIRREAEATSSVAKLLYIDTFLSNKMAYLRFNFATGDAAGQNMVGRATFAACSWILEQRDDIVRF
ncbi:MAG: hydroxymethylglutaryl-CoA reductase, partial [Acidobacteriota bacterium]